MNAQQKIENKVGHADAEFRSEVSQLFLRIRAGDLTPDQEKWLRARLEFMLRDLEARLAAKNGVKK